MHGLDGGKDDLRVYENYIRLAYPHSDEALEFLLCESVQSITWNCVAKMVDALCDEVLLFCAKYERAPRKIS